MKTQRNQSLPSSARFRCKGLNLCVTAIIAFASGSLLTAHLLHLQEVRAESRRVFELMVYHTQPGKAPALASVFRDVSQLQTKHHLDAVGYWLPEDDSTWKNTFIYLIAHPSRNEAGRNWDALHADPAFLPYRKLAEPLIEKIKQEYNVEEIYMRPADYSPMK